MNRICLIFIIYLFHSLTGFSQPVQPSRLKVFIDCSNSYCDIQYIRSEINIVDYLLDNQAADLHVLITSQVTGSGGEQYQLIFFGQQQFKNQRDTMRFIIAPNSTDFEKRSQLLKYLKTGLIPYIIKTSAVKHIEISLKSSDSATAGSENSITKDPWNYWVLRIGGEGNINADANYNNMSYSGNFSANRITNKIKTGFGLIFNKNRSEFEFEENDSTKKFVVNNHSWMMNQYVVRSINTHWSWAYEIKFSQNTFNNNKGRVYGKTAIEYNIFPYKDVNNKLFTLSYGLTARSNHYFDTTIYNKKKETLFGQRADAFLSLNQKWGNSYAGISYHGYLHNWNFFSLGIELYTNIRITGGLSFYILTFGGITRDQVFLVKGNATPEEVLAKRRQLASGYNYYTSIGLTYRFGSKLNNVVNPRFERTGYMNED